MSKFKVGDTVKLLKPVNKYQTGDVFNIDEIIEGYEYPIRIMHKNSDLTFGVVEDEIELVENIKSSISVEEILKGYQASLDTYVESNRLSDESVWLAAATAILNNSPSWLTEEVAKKADNVVKQFNMRFR